MKERWRPIAGFPYYEVSDQGRVRSLDRIVYVTASAGRCAHTKLVRGRIIKLPRPIKTYVPVKFGTKNYRLHRIVLEAFRGKRPPGKEARHRDGDRFNNALRNLEWSTRSKNLLDVKYHGRAPRMLDPAVVRKIKQRLKDEPQCNKSALAREFGISDNTIRRMLDGRGYRDIKV